MTLKFELSRDYCTMHLPSEFHYHMFNVQKLTCSQAHKQTDILSKTLTSICYATPMDNNQIAIIKTAE